ncbi:MAG: hypothetical protein OEV94_03095 [Deltaproteobacteria bacterium]|nr:hypothetical protein [Deltaproteobacteria bacterium]
MTNRLELHAGIRSFDAYTDGAYISRNYVGVANYIKPEGDTWFFELDYEDYQAYAPKGNLVVLDKSKFASLGMGYQWFWENGFTMGVGLGYPHLVNIPLGWSF